MNKDDIIEEVISGFDFYKVHYVMSLLDWKWSREGTLSVPSVSIMKKEVKRLFDTAWDRSLSHDDNYTLGTGGFYVSVNTKDGSASLKFILEEYEGVNYD